MASDKLIREINSIFSSRMPFYSYGSLPRTLSIGRNNIYSKYIVIDLNEEVIEVPAFLRQIFSEFINNLRSTYRSDNFKKPSCFVVPMYIGGTPVLKKTGDSLLTMCLNATLKQRILPFNTPDGLLYYGNRGFIIHDDKALMMATVKFKITEDYLYSISDYNLNISPSIFVNKDLVSRAILSKIVPVFIENNRTGENIKILIEDKSNIIESPIPPKNVHVNLEINNILVSNLDAIAFKSII